MSGNVLEYVTPPLANRIAQYTINVLSDEMLGIELGATGAGIISTTAGANGIILIPMALSAPFVINQFFWVNGSTVNGNSYIGVYSEAGSLLVSSGAVVNSGASVRQAVDITDFRLAAPRRYWLALGTDSASHTFTRFTTSAPLSDYLGVKSMAAGISGGALVSTVTFANGSNTTWWCGMTGSATI